MTSLWSHPPRGMSQGRRRPVRHPARRAGVQRRPCLTPTCMRLAVSRRASLASRSRRNSLRRRDGPRPQGQTDQQAFYTVLSKPENRYLARQLCWVLTIQGLETYIVQPRDPRDFDRLVEVIRRQPSPMEFIMTFSSLAAEHIQAHVVDQIAKAGVGIGKAGGGVTFSVNFDTEPGYGTVPHHWGWPKALLGEAIDQELISVRQSAQ
jgi:hypothetical protein